MNKLFSEIFKEWTGNYVEYIGKFTKKYQENWCIKNMVFENRNKSGLSKTGVSENPCGAKGVSKEDTSQKM
jgi:hypothetical protein